MTTDELFLKIRDFLISLNGTWSATKILMIATIADDFKMRRQEALKRIRFICGESCAKPGPKKRSGTELGTDPGTELRSVPTPLFPTPLSPATPIPVTLISLPPLRVTEPPKAARSRSKEPDTTWVDPLVSATQALSKQRLSSLAAQSRYLVSQYHCLRFGNCSRDERGNRIKATVFAKGFVSVAMSEEYGSLTVGEYLHYQKKSFTMQGSVPLFDPWAFKSAIEVDA